MARKPTYEELEQRIKDLERSESLRKSAGSALRQDMDGFQGDSHESRSIQVSGIHIAWNAQRGTCTFENLPVAMMWVDTTLAGMMSGVQAMVGTERFALALQSEGRKSVEADWEVISQFPDFREGFRAIANIAAVAGWGEWVITRLDEQRRECHIRVRESWEGRYQRALGECWGSAMLAGKMAGYCSKLFGTNCWADQTAFIARGEPHDEFVVRPSHRSMEKEIKGLLASDEATRADMAVALRKLEKEMSERNRMEEALRESEARLRMLSDNLPGGMVYQIDSGEDGSERRFLYVSGGVEKMHGIKEAEALNDAATIYGQVLEEDRRLLIEREALALATMTSFSAEVRFRLPSGEVAWRLLRSAPRRLFTHHLVWDGIEIDVTERKRAEGALRESEEKHKALFEEAPVGYMEYDDKGMITRVNRRELEMLGYTPEEMVGKPAWSFVVESEKGRELIKAKLAGKNSPSKNLERTYIRKDGTTFPGLIEDAIFKDRSGRIIGIRSTIQDISERKRMEESLRESEERYRNILESIEDGYYEVDLAGNFTFFNDSVCELLGYSKEELMGMNNRQYTESENAKKLYDTFNEVYRTGRPTKGFDWEVNRKDGIKRFVEASVSLMKDTEGKTTGFRGIARDVTDRKRAEEERQRLEAQLQQAQKMESVGRLAGGVAHDFNNMLGIIIGNAEMAALQVDPDGPVHLNLQEIIKASHRAADTVRQLLAFARKQTINPKVIDLNDTVEGMLKMLRRLVGEDIDLLWMPGKPLGKVKVDSSQINQILANLVVNARDAISSVGKITIETANALFDGAYCRNHEGFIPGEYVLLSVGDTGTGMTPEIMEHLFDPFFTTKETGKGTGLGLATIYGIVKQNHGFINVYSEAGQGSTFKIYFPRCEGESVVIQEQSEETLPKGTETILIAEDEPPLLRIAKEILTSQGYTVLAAKTPSEALGLAKEHIGEIHLLVTDVVMPEMNGRQLAERLKQDHLGLKCLFMSGYTANVVAHHGVLDEGVDFIEKPFSPSVLAKKVREVLDGKKS